MFVSRLFASVVLMLSCAVAVGQVAGQNINMVSGTNWPSGDPFLQRQNEPSMAVSSRNPEHLLGGANDYRTVDIPNPAAPTILGDAWLGVYSSMDGGETWKSTLLPGYPQDTSAVGTASPLHSFTVATDPTVRAGTNGMFYYSGLVFNRGTGMPSGVFVATFQDQDNKGPGNAAIQMTANGNGNPLLYIGVNLVDSGNSGQFLDKPWIAVDIPRPGRTATCKVNGRTFSSGYAYVFYTQFNGSQNNPASKIKVVTSTNCGVSWSQPQILSQSQKLAQGTVAAIDPNNGNVYVSWRQIAVAGNPNQLDAIQWAVSTNGGNSFAYEPAVYTFVAHTNSNPYPPGSAFDQPQANSTTFRWLDVPTMAVDAKSRVWVAFSERVNGPTAGTYGSRIMISTLPSGATQWTTPYMADSTAPTTTYGHQFMPALNFAYGKLMLAWFDSRRDNLESVLQCPSGGTCTDLSQVKVVDQPLPGSSISNPATIFTPTISDPNLGVRHTIDVFGGIVNPSAGPTAFKGFQISQYPYYVDDANNQIEQGFFNPPNLPMFVQGTTPFLGDYIDIAAQSILPNGNSWVFNTQATDPTGATNAPDFHVTWTDNRDVVPPPVVNGSQDWTQYVPPNGGNSQVSTYAGTGSACPTCTTTQTACTIVTPDGGGSSSYSGDRNQNVYTSRITNGLVVRFKEAAKPLSTTVPRSFSLLVKNTVSPLSTTPLDSPSYYRILLGVTSASQTPSCTVTGGNASLPGTPNCYLDVAVNPKTTVTQAITVTSSSATANINVLVAQIACIPGTPAGSTTCPNTPTFLGLQALSVINGDPTNPSVANPDFLTTDNDNPDVTTPYGVLPIASGEEYDPTVDSPPNPTSGIFTPKIGVPAIFTPKIGTVANSAPQIETPTIFTPKITSIFTPKINSIQIANPTIVDTIFTPKIFTPKIFTPKIVSPDIFTPKITDLSDSGGANSLTDYTWRVSNKGNTSASYDTTEFAKASGVSCCPASCSATPNQCTMTATNPAGPNCSVCQLVQQKVYQSPVANRDSTNMNATCDLTVQQQYITVANIPDPAFSVGTVGNTSPSSPTNSTLALSPGEGNRVTLRVVAPPQTQQTVGSFKTVATALSADKGQTTPAGSLTITSSVLPVAVVGQSYTNTTLMSVGGFGTTAWSVPPDPTNPVPATLPISPEPLPVTPLTLNQSGQISTGIVTAAPGTYTVNLQVQDAAITPSLDVQQIPLQVNQFTISNVNVAIINEVGSTSYMKAGDMAIVSVTVSSTGPATASSVVPTLMVNALAGGTPSGPTPLLTCSAPVPTSAIIMSTGTQMFNFTCTAASGNGYVTFTAHATGQYNNAAANVLATATPVSQPALTPSGIPPNVIVDTVAPTLAFGTTTSTQSAPGWYNAPVVISFTTSDNLSGVMSASATPPATSTGLNSGVLTLTTEGKLVTGTITVTDYARNTAAPFTSAGFNIDETKPTISGMANPPANGAGWNNTPVTVTFTCNDPNPLSGPGQQSGLVAGVAGCTAPVTLSSAGANQRASGTANDVAGNSASTTVTPINIDLIPPVVVLASPVDGHAYINNQPIPANYACSDDLSGVASCLAPVAAGNSFTQTAPGAYSFTVTSSDVAGNASFGRNGYSSVYYNFAGFQSPLAGAAGPGTPATPPSAPTNSGMVQGAVIPILWTLASPSSTLNPGPVTDPTTMTSLNAYPYGTATCSGGIPTSNTPIPLPAATYDATNQRFQSLWNTSAVTPGCYYLLITFNDLSSYATNVTIPVITAVAGNGTFGYSGDGFAPTSAEFEFPTSVAVDSAGNVYIADNYNHRIRVVNMQASALTILGVTIQAGTIATVAGNGTAGYTGDSGPSISATLTYPNGVALDGAGNLYIADTGNNVIREVNAATGIITTVAGGGTPCGGATDTVGDGCLATSAQLAGPYLVTVDSNNNLFIADTQNARVRVVNMQASSSTILGVTVPSGYIATVAGTGTPGYSGDSGPATSAQLSNDTNGVAVDSQGNLYIGDANNCIVRKVVNAGAYNITTFAGTPSTCGTAAGDGGPAISATLNLPTAVSVDSAGNLYIADWANNLIRVVNTQASSITAFGVTILPGNIATIAGGGTGCPGQTDTFGDGCQPTSAQLLRPNVVAFDSAGNLYIADSNNQLIRKVAP